MADVLGVAALEVGDPVAVVVLMEGDDFARKVHLEKDNAETKGIEELSEKQEKG